MIVAGDPNGTPTDSPANRVDANTITSPFAGVGSLQVNTRRGTFICTATPIGSRHILTAGHCVDINNDGKSDRKDGIKSISFILNFGGNQTSKIQVSQIAVHPDFTGFNRPSINDDVSVLTLSSSLPTGAPVYRLPTADLAAGTTVTMVGYGRSGDGVNGYYTSASFTVKRRGENNADAFLGQDDAGKPAANEVFRFDFDGASGSGTFGGPTLGNDRETQFGGGDSGGPSFVDDGLGQVVVGVNTFTQGTAPFFGSLGGGINVFPYVGFINSVVTGAAPASASQSGGTNGSGGKAANKPAGSVAEVAAVVEALAELAGLTQAADTVATPTSVVVPPPAAPDLTLPTPLPALGGRLTTMSSASFGTGEFRSEGWIDDAEYLDDVRSEVPCAQENRAPAGGVACPPAAQTEAAMPEVVPPEPVPARPEASPPAEQVELLLLPGDASGLEPHVALAAAAVFAGTLGEVHSPVRRKTLVPRN